jgi:hypothetical protein
MVHAGGYPEKAGLLPLEKLLERPSLKIFQKTFWKQKQSPH